jgi:putative membrane protein
MRREKTNARRAAVSTTLNIARGFLMGTADVVPGVSGGTIALVVGIYERLVTSISRIDGLLVRHLQRRQWGAAARHIELAFLVPLGLGIVLGIVTLGSTMERLLVSEAWRPITLAVFLGMILGSTILVAGLINVTRPSTAALYVLLGIGSAGFAFWITGLPKSSAEITLGYVFVCGMIGICAMILPGISGAYLLLILGLYSDLTGILHRLAHAQTSWHDVVTVAVFSAGCVVGIVTFSKLLKWLLAGYRSPTMVILCGLMIGALRKVWPFQRDLTQGAKELKEKEFALYWPPAIDGTVVTVVVVALVALAAVLIIDRAARLQNGGDTPAP